MPEQWDLWMPFDESGLVPGRIKQLLCDAAAPGPRTNAAN